MFNFRNQRGSITLYVLTSCLFFMASITGVFIYTQSKQVAVEKEYRQIKSIYESNLNETSLQQIKTQEFDI